MVGLVSRSQTCYFQVKSLIYTGSSALANAMKYFWPLNSVYTHHLASLWKVTQPTSSPLLRSLSNAWGPTTSICTIFTGESVLVVVVLDKDDVADLRLRYQS